MPAIRLRKSFRIALLFLGLVAAEPCFAQGWSSATPWILEAPDVQHVDLAIIKRRIHLAKSVEAYVAPLDKLYPVALNESRLRGMGCRLSTADAVKVADLVKILDDSDLKSVSFSPTGFDPRELIYLRLSNGETMKIVLQGGSRASPSVSGTIDYKQISVNARAVADLYRWTAATPKDSSCSRSPT